MGAGMTATAAARTALHTALAATPIGRRAHKYRPPNPATPLVFVDDAETVTADEVTITLPVVVVVDGADPAQAAFLDDWGDLVEDAAYAARYRSAGRTPSLLDVGGPTLRSVTVRVEVDHVGPTLCPAHPLSPEESMP
jgi:hypothetical protein